MNFLKKLYDKAFPTNSDARQKNSYHLVTFKQSVDKKLKGELLSIPSVKQICGSGRWIVNFKAMKIQKWYEIIDFLSETKINELSLLCYSKQQGIIKHQQTLLLKSVIFPIYSQLHDLIIMNCELQSIQFITYMNIPKIRSLKLFKTHITCLKCMDKTNWPLFYEFSSVWDKSTYFEMNRVKTFNTMRFLHVRKYCSNQQIEYLAKAQFRLIKQVHLVNENTGIIQNKIVKMLMRKYPETFWISSDIDYPLMH